MKQHMEHCVGAAFVPRAMTCYLCDMQFASIAGYKQHMEHAHNADDAATSYNQRMDARYTQKRHEEQAQARDGAGVAGIEADAKKPADIAGGGGESKSTHPTIAAALGFGMNKLSPNKDGRRYPCSVCSSTFTRVDNMRAHMLKFHGIEVAPNSAGNSRRSTPVSMVASYYDAGVSSVHDSPSMVPRHVGSLSPHQQPSPIVIQPDGFEDSKVNI